MKVCPVWFHFIRLICLTFLRSFTPSEPMGPAPYPRVHSSSLPTTPAIWIHPPQDAASFASPTTWHATLYSLPDLLLATAVDRVDSCESELPGPSSLKNIFEVLKRNGTLVLFPEGQRTFDGTLGKAEPGIGMIAARANVPVVPVHIIGSHEAMPRNGSWHPFRPMQVVYGQPMRFQGDPKNRDDFQKFADQIMAAIASLKVNSH